MINDSDLTVGSFITGSYKFGVIAGFVLEIKSKVVIIDKCDMCYSQCKRTGNKVNVTISRIREVGTPESLGYREVSVIDTNSK